MGICIDTAYQDTINEYYQNSVKGYDVFTLILKVFVVLLLLFLLVRMLMQVIHFLLRPRSYADDVTELVNEEPNQYKERVTDRHILRRLTDEERARRIYKRSILRYKNVITLNRRLTCEDIRQEISESEDGNVDGVSAIYEQIRYGDRTVDGFVIQDMQEASRQTQKDTSPRKIKREKCENEPEEKDDCVVGSHHSACSSCRGAVCHTGGKKPE